MQPPDELMMDIFLPSMRQLVSKRLHDLGLPQVQISRLLGITQASVSLYLSSSPERAYSSLSTLSISHEEADRYAALLSEDAASGPLEAQETMTTIWRSILGKGMACNAHRALYPGLAECDICMREMDSILGGAGDIAEVSQAVGVLERSTSFPAVMPEVSVNLAFAPGPAESPEDVIAIPGRIVKVRNRARTMAKPEFGASRHLAKVLLISQKKQAGVRACINLRYDSKMQRAIRHLRLKTIRIGGYPASPNRDSTLASLASGLAGSKGDFDAIIDTGGAGVEPSLYLFSKGPRQAADLALKLAGLYSAD
ncbi:MAG TPA: thiamine-phosphate synthase family protein [Nitrososphaerales archaeon]|nr:thiamine-phosphate synthase family protein [Nitrososphaerales archaeon]